MNAASQPPPAIPSADSLEARTMKKIGRRLLPLVFTLYAVAYLDRASVAYAKLTMTVDLGFSEAVYGFGAGLFFVGYLLLEIPGALIVHRWGARLWMSRILISWGFVTVMTGFVRTANDFYFARFLLGVAEAGFIPGAIVYLNQWFPSQHRARAMARLLIGGTFALVIGGPISGAILTVNWMGLAGWRWVFILEGIPAVTMGVLILFIMTDRPAKASWLRPEEREWVINELEAEKQRKVQFGKITVWQAFRHPAVLILAALEVLANMGNIAFGLWLPTMIQRASGLPPHLAAAVSALPFVTAVIGQLTSSWSSDRKRERIFHTAIPLFLAGIIFPITTLPGMSFGWLLFWLCMSSAAIWAQGPPFWTLPTVVLGEAPAAAAIGFINTVGQVGGFFGPTLVGVMLTAGYSFDDTTRLLSLGFIASGMMALGLRRYVPARGSETAQPEPPDAR